MTTRIHLDPILCPNCGRELAAVGNGGGIFLRCPTDPPRCGVIWPAGTALALNQKAREEGARRPWTEEERSAGVRRLDTEPPRPQEAIS